MAIVDGKGTVSPLNPLPGHTHRRGSTRTDSRIAYRVEEAQGFNIWIYDLDGRSAARRADVRWQQQPIPGLVRRRPAHSVSVQSRRRSGPVPAAGRCQRRFGRAARPGRSPGPAYVPESLSRPEDILSVSVVKGATTALWTLSMRDRKMTPFGDVRSTNLLNSEFSPDGHWIAYTVRGGPSLTTVIVEPFPATGARYRISKPDDVAHHALWAPDGKSLFYVPGKPIGSRRQHHHQAGVFRREPVHSAG